MFDQNSIELLTSKYQIALTNEYETKQAAQDERATAELLKATVIGDAESAGRIDGKNKDTREIQRDSVIAGDAEYQNALRVIAKADDTAARNEIIRKTIDAKVELTKAWLRSQGR